MKEYVDYILNKTYELLNIDSPTGYTLRAVNYLKDEFINMGYEPVITTKGGLFVDLGGNGNGLLIEAHLDTLGAIVSEILPNGHLKVSSLGGLNANNIECENCRIYTHFDNIYEGVAQLSNPSIHVNKDYNDTLRKFDNIEIILDEVVKSKEDVLKLNINNGDIVCFDPRVKITDSGYIKSRFLDDKYSCGILLGLAKYLKDHNITLNRHISLHFTVYEEVGHGASASVPADTNEILSVDMGCIGNGLVCDEQMVSICAKDSAGPYNYQMVDKLIHLAKENDLNYAIDVYPYYSSDAQMAVRSGHDVKHALIGPGVYASHGYERSHRDGALNTLKLLIAYVKE